MLGRDGLDTTCEVSVLLVKCLPLIHEPFSQGIRQEVLLLEFRLDFFYDQILAVLDVHLHADLECVGGVPVDHVALRGPLHCMKTVVTSNGSTCVVNCISLYFYITFLIGVYR